MYMEGIVQNGQFKKSNLTAHINAYTKLRETNSDTEFLQPCPVVVVNAFREIGFVARWVKIFLMKETIKTSETSALLVNTLQEGRPMSI